MKLTGVFGLITLILTLVFTACDIFRPPVSESEEEIAVLETHASQDEPLPSAKPHISVLSTDRNPHFWPYIMAGASDAAREREIVLDFLKTKSESGFMSIEELNEPQNISAICVSADDDAALSQIFEYARENNLPVTGFSFGASNAPSDAVLSVASTDNYLAGTAAAQAMLRSPVFLEKIKNASTASKATVAILTQLGEEKAASERSRGFSDEMTKKIKDINSDGVHVAADGTDGAVVISVVPLENRNEAATLLQETDSLVGVFCADQEAAESLIEATRQGRDLDRGIGIYKDLTVIGFGAGEKQKSAVKNQYFYGAVAEDPYMMGYMAISLAYDALQGDKLPEAVDSGLHIYTFENINRKDISSILYD